MGTNRMRITLRRSPIGYSKRQKLTLQALGLRRVSGSVVHDSTPSTRGMIEKVKHLVEVEEV